MREYVQQGTLSMKTQWGNIFIQQTFPHEQELHNTEEEGQFQQNQTTVKVKVGGHLPRPTDVSGK